MTTYQKLEFIRKYIQEARNIDYPHLKKYFLAQARGVVMAYGADCSISTQNVIDLTNEIETLMKEVGQ
ncbi:hypothetical protein vBPFY1MI_109 [Pseudomonas phage vB_PF_Y1-MI]|nr:hypothetical protein vBPFY1MI_109 [Pseudomonas phage vB_PF_Y1-MI]